MFNKDDTGSNIVPTGHNTSCLRENDAQKRYILKQVFAVGKMSQLNSLMFPQENNLMKHDV